MKAAVEFADAVLSCFTSRYLEAADLAPHELGGAGVARDIVGIGAGQQSLARIIEYAISDLRSVGRFVRRIKLGCLLRHGGDCQLAG